MADALMLAAGYGLAVPDDDAEILFVRTVRVKRQWPELLVAAAAQVRDMLGIAPERAGQDGAARPAGPAGRRRRHGRRGRVAEAAGLEQGAAGPAPAWQHRVVVADADEPVRQHRLGSHGLSSGFQMWPHSAAWQRRCGSPAGPGE
jgi:hypothetical protein